MTVMTVYKPCGRCVMNTEDSEEPRGIVAKMPFPTA